MSSTPTVVLVHGPFADASGYGGVIADLAAMMAVSQSPLSLAALTEKATVPGWKDLPSWYPVSARPQHSRLEHGPCR